MYTVSLEKFIQKMKVKNLTPDVDISAIEITQSDVNRPALQLAGFFDYFDHHRIQIIGQVEHTYMEKQGIEESLKQMKRILSYKVPGIVFCIGIIDAKTLFGVESVKNTQSIDLVIQLEEWNKEQEYDRMGLEEQYIEYLGNKVVCHSIPIRPGRNVAIICESAAVNYRQKKMGYNAARELYNRVTSNNFGKA